MAGRPKTFDPEQALGQALDLFWLYGYQATSLHALLDAMGISRQSSYDTFGSKRELFERALDAYDRMMLGRVTELLQEGDTPLGGVHRLVHFFVEHVAAQPFQGCLINNSAVELGPHDEAVAAVVRRHWEALEGRLKAALDQVAAAGELAPETDTRALARFLLGTIQGLLVLGKAGADPAVAQDIARVALGALAPGGEAG